MEDNPRNYTREDIDEYGRLLIKTNVLHRDFDPKNTNPRSSGGYKWNRYYLFDVSKQSEKLKYSTTDIQIKMHFNTNVPANTQAYAVIISDRLINFQSDGNKFSVVY